MPQAQAGPALTLIQGTREDVDFGLAPAGPDGGDWGERMVEHSLLRRPGDHVELWTFGDAAALEPIRRAARERGLNADTAIALVVERRLILGDLQRMGCAHAEEIINRCGSVAQPTSELWSAHSAYLRHLLHGDELERKSRMPLHSPRAALPIRLVDRLSGHEIFSAPATSGGELERAVEWEMAALYRGELMGEWAYRCALAHLP